MNKLDFQKLNEAGMDVDGFLKRLMGNAELIKIFVKKFTDDKNFENLKTAFNNRNMKDAELASHTLKGMCGNLSLIKLYDLFTEQVNLIRTEKFTKAEDMMPEISDTYCRTIETMNEWLGGLL